MSLTPIQRVRYKTTLNETLLPDQVITDLIELNTVDGVWNFEATVADCYDYMAASMAGDPSAMIGNVKSVTIGVTSVTYATTYADLANWWRNQAGLGNAKLTQGSITRQDYGGTSGTEFGHE
jgi:hypothetical protein